MAHSPIPVVTATDCLYVDETLMTDLNVADCDNSKAIPIGWLHLLPFDIGHADA